MNNRLQLSIAGAVGPHSISFGASSDTSNALGMLGIANASATNAANPTLTGTTNLGVTRMLSALDSSGIAGLTSTTTGVLTINGVAISYDTTKDSLSTVVSRINNAGGGRHRLGRPDQRPDRADRSSPPARSPSTSPTRAATSGPP